MSIESQRDVAGLQRIGRIVGTILRELESRVRAGVTTAELDWICAQLLAEHGARSAPPMYYGFPGSLCISVNEEVVHGVPGSRSLAAGDLVKLDLVAEKEGYIADSAATVAIPPVAPAARALARCARRAFQRALPVIRAGRRIADIGHAIEREVRRCGFRVVRELAGHGVGRAIHEEPSVPNFGDPSDRRLLTEGLVLAIEPIVAAGSGQVVEGRDGWTIRTVDGGLAAHHEHTLIVTRGHPLILTAV
jgi:methionyl aminopeptidase